MEKLKGAGVGVEWRGGWSQRCFMQMMQFCLQKMRNRWRGLKVLEKWCNEWPVEINVEKTFL